MDGTKVQPAWWIIEFCREINVRPDDIIEGMGALTKANVDLSDIDLEYSSEQLCELFIQSPETSHMVLNYTYKLNPRIFQENIRRWIRSHPETLKHLLAELEWKRTRAEIESGNVDSTVP